MTTYEIQGARLMGSIASMEAKDRRDALDGILKNIYALKGFTVADKVQPEIDEAVARLEDKVVQRWPGMTIGEVNIALEAGVCGELGGNDRRLTIANYFGWLNAYVASPERRDAMNVISRRTAPASAQLEERPVGDRNDDAGRAGANALWDAYKRTGRVETVTLGYPAMVYDWLHARGKVKPTDETVREAERQAARLRMDTWRAATGALDYATKTVLLEKYFHSLRSRGAELNI